MEKTLNHAEEGTVNAAGGMVDMTEGKTERKKGRSGGRLMAGPKRGESRDITSEWFGKGQLRQGVDT